jgi:protein-S-isoprenylcysteine O-methyltransferase Ste14
MSEKQFYATSNQMVAIILDVLGIILVLVGASIARAHSGQGVGLGIYWVGFILLIVALILFVWNMRKSPVEKT